MGFFSKLFGGKEPEPEKPAPRAEEKPEKADWESVGGVPQEMAATEVLDVYNSSDRPVFLDVREPHELEANGYIPGSIHIPMHEVQGRVDELDPQKPIIVYCASGMRSMDVGAFLLESGFADVSNLNGGLQNWAGPLEKG